MQPTRFARGQRLGLAKVSIVHASPRRGVRVAADAFVRRAEDTLPV